MIACTVALPSPVVFSNTVALPSPAVFGDTVGVPPFDWLLASEADERIVTEDGDFVII